MAAMGKSRDLGEDSSLKAVLASRLKSRIAELEEQNAALHADKEALTTQLTGIQQVHRLAPLFAPDKAYTAAAVALHLHTGSCGPLPTYCV